MLILILFLTNPCSSKNFSPNSIWPSTPTPPKKRTKKGGGEEREAEIEIRDKRRQRRGDRGKVLLSKEEGLGGR